jgi:hypothetical protein
MFGRNVPTVTVKTVSVNMYLRLYTTTFHNSEKLQLLFSAWRHVSAAHAPIFRPTYFIVNTLLPQLVGISRLQKIVGDT